MFINEIDKLDQHFLIDEEVINKFISFCNLKESDTVVEVGPGMGNITKILCETCGHVISIEKDIRLNEWKRKSRGSYKSRN